MSRFSDLQIGIDDIKIGYDIYCTNWDGLENLYPFCVKGNLEPDRFLCVVSHWHCHIIIENDDRCPLDKDEIIHEFSDYL